MMKVWRMAAFFFSLFLLLSLFTRNTPNGASFDSIFMCRSAVCETNVKNFAIIFLLLIWICIENYLYYIAWNRWVFVCYSLYMSRTTGRSKDIFSEPVISEYLIILREWIAHFFTHTQQIIRQNLHDSNLRYVLRSPVHFAILAFEVWPLMSESVPFFLQTVLLCVLQCVCVCAQVGFVSSFPP